METICIAGKNRIAVECADIVFHDFPDINLWVLPNKDDVGIDTWQPSLKKWAQEKNIHQTSLGEIYRIKDLVFISLEYDRIVNPDCFHTKRLYNLHFSLLPEY